ncbi:extensin-like [Cryptomeria japonica]|uniref:extensin-like n=1 Tax=Cryptomeria japonica TaxID=3369 RepID=UPI0027D9E6F3|nr:extensin-like [Cryptomeria japonica]
MKVIAIPRPIILKGRPNPRRRNPRAAEPEPKRLRPPRRTQAPRPPLTVESGVLRLPWGSQALRLPTQWRREGLWPPWETQSPRPPLCVGTERTASGARGGAGRPNPRRRNPRAAEPEPKRLRPPRRTQAPRPPLTVESGVLRLPWGSQALRLPTQWRREGLWPPWETQSPRPPLCVGTERTASGARGGAGRPNPRRRNPRAAEPEPKRLRPPRRTQAPRPPLTVESGVLRLPWGSQALRLPTQWRREGLWPPWETQSPRPPLCVGTERTASGARGGAGRPNPRRRNPRAAEPEPKRLRPPRRTQAPRPPLTVESGVLRLPWGSQALRLPTQWRREGLWPPWETQSPRPPLCVGTERTASGARGGAG